MSPKCDTIIHSKHNKPIHMMILVLISLSHVPRLDIQPVYYTVSRHYPDTTARVLFHTTMKTCVRLVQWYVIPTLFTGRNRFYDMRSLAIQCYIVRNMLRLILESAKVAWHIWYISMATRCWVVATRQTCGMSPNPFSPWGLLAALCYSQFTIKLRIWRIWFDDVEYWNQLNNCLT